MRREEHVVPRPLVPPAAVRPRHLAQVLVRRLAAGEEDGEEQLLLQRRRGPAGRDVVERLARQEAEYRTRGLVSLPLEHPADVGEQAVPPCLCAMV